MSDCKTGGAPYSKEQLASLRAEAAWRFWYKWTQGYPKLRSELPAKLSEIDRLMARAAARGVAILGLSKRRAVAWMGINNARHANTDLHPETVEAIEAAVRERVRKKSPTGYGVRLAIYGIQERSDGSRGEQPLRRSAKGLRIVELKPGTKTVEILPPGNLLDARIVIEARRAGRKKIVLHLSYAEDS